MARCLKDIELELEKEAGLGAVASLAGNTVGKGLARVANGAAKHGGAAMYTFGKKIVGRTNPGGWANRYADKFVGKGKNLAAWGTQKRANVLGSNIKNRLSSAGNQLKTAWRAPAAV